MYSPGRLERKIIIGTFIPAALAMLIVSFAILQAYRQVTEDLVVQRNRELVRQMSARLQSELTGLATRMERLARSSARYRGDHDAISIVLSNDATLLDIFDGGIFVLDYMGMVLQEIAPGKVEPPETLASSELFQHITMRGLDRRVISDAGALAQDGEVYLAVSVPVADQGEMVIGLLSIASPNKGLTALIRQLRFQAEGEFYLIDGNGLVIYHSNAEMVGLDYTERPIVQQALAGKVGSERTQTVDGLDVVISYTPVLDTRWGMVIFERWSVLVGGHQTYLWLLLTLLALSVLGPAWVAVISARRLTRPIQEITLAAEEVSGGRFGRTITANTGDEVEELADQFNKMSQELEAYYTQLEERAAARSRELDTLNQLATVISRSFDLREIMDSAIEQSTRAMNMDAGAILLLEKDGQLHLQAQEGLSDEFVDKVAVLHIQEGAAGEAAKTGRPSVRYLDDYKTDWLRDAVANEGLNLVVSIPLIAKGQMLGALNLCSRTQREITPEELSLLASIGQQVGIAVENARLYEQAEDAAAAAERTRLARELHDAVTQTLFSATLISEVLPAIWELDPEEGQRRLKEVGQLNKGALAEMRTLLLELRPSALVDAPLTDLFRHLADSFTGRTGCPVELSLQVAADLPPEVKITFYRVAQEAMANAGKHAEASCLCVGIFCNDKTARLLIQDDGKGFNPSAIPSNHFGLGNMRERAENIGARLSIVSESGEGTEVELVWMG